jgi:hypothetical protein
MYNIGVIRIKFYNAFVFNFSHFQICRWSILKITFFVIAFFSKVSLTEYELVGQKLFKQISQASTSQLEEARDRAKSLNLNCCAEQTHILQTSKQGKIAYNLNSLINTVLHQFYRQGVLPCFYRFSFKIVIYMSLYRMPSTLKNRAEFLLF